MTFRLGLTGSIGMGKTATAALFAARGWPVWDADSAVHRLYRPGGDAVGAVAAAFPGALADGAIDRATLRAVVTGDPTALARLESIVHPLVARDREGFIAAARQAGTAIVVLDIPLLFETGAEDALDGVAVVSTDAATQRARVLARPGMTPAMLDLILARQMPDAAKRALSRWIIPTDTPAAAAAAVDRICADILGPTPDGGRVAPDRP